MLPSQHCCSLILLLQSALCRQALEGSHLTHFNWREASSRSRAYNIHILKVNAPPTPNRDLLYTTQLAHDNDVADSRFLESGSVIDLIEYCKPETRTRNPGLPFSKPETRVWTTGSGFGNPSDSDVHRFSVTRGEINLCSPTIQ